MARSTSIETKLNSWIDSLKIAIIEDNEKTIYNLCTNIPSNLGDSSRFEEACSLISGIIKEFEKRKNETQIVLNSLQQSKRYFNKNLISSKGRLNIQS